MIAVKINPLREFHYPTWDDLGHALGFEARALANHRGLSSKRRTAPSGKLKAAVDSLFEQKFPFPLPPAQLLFREEITAAKREPGSLPLLNAIRKIEFVRSMTPNQPLDAAGLKYLEYLACHARGRLNNRNGAFGDKTLWRASLARGIAALQEGRAIIARALSDPSGIPDLSTLKELDVVLFLNWVVALGSYIFDDTPPDPTELATKLGECDALARFRSALQDLPYEWRVAYSGLDVASRLRASDDDLRLFYSRLCDFDSGFREFTHTPGEVLAIADNPELGFFRERCRLNPTITTPTHKE